MALSRLLNLLALATVAIFASTHGAEPVHALSGHSSLNGKGHAIIARGHGSMVKKRRTQQKRCRVREQNGNNTDSGSNDGSNDSNSNDNNNHDNLNGGSNSTDGDKGVNQPSNGGNQSNTDGNQSNTGGAQANTGGSQVNTGGSQVNTGGSQVNTGGSQANTGGAQASGGSGNGKVCLAWPNGNDPALANFQTSNSGVIYTWSPFKPDNTYGYKFVPMLWGEKQIDDFTAQVHAGNFEYVMGFNEPEMDGQAKMTPQRGAELWKQHIQPLASSGAKLVTPGVTSAPQSKPWLMDFFKACDGCTFEAVSVHYYGTSADDLINYITDFHNTFQKPIWLTEYACQNFSGSGGQCSPQDIQNFMDKVKKFAEETEWVHQYCWFGAMHNMVDVNPGNQLMNPEGKPTALGLDFLGLKA